MKTTVTTRIHSELQKISDVKKEFGRRVRTDKIQWMNDNEFTFIYFGEVNDMINRIEERFFDILDQIIGADNYTVQVDVCR